MVWGARYAGNVDADRGPLMRVRLLPQRPDAAGLLKAHIEAFDHLAVVSELGDGSVCVEGPFERADDIIAACDELARELGLLRVQG